MTLIGSDIESLTADPDAIVGPLVRRPRPSPLPGDTAALCADLTERAAAGIAVSSLEFRSATEEP